MSPLQFGFRLTSSAQTPYLNPNLVSSLYPSTRHPVLIDDPQLSDVLSNIAILSHALSGGHALPGSLPSLRDRLVYHERVSGRGTIVSTGFRHIDESVPMDLDAGDSDSEREGEEQVDGSSIGFEQLTLDVLMVRHGPWGRGFEGLIRCVCFRMINCQRTLRVSLWSLPTPNLRFYLNLSYWLISGASPFQHNHGKPRSDEAPRCLP